MSCEMPLPAVNYGLKKNDEGKLVYDIKLLDMKHRYYGYGLEELKELFGDKLVLLPCGHCYSCCCDYSDMWATRIMLEAQDHARNCFITLTYANWYKPDKPSKVHFQKFIRRLRKNIDCKIRYFGCGEIGEGKGERKEGNPHYHILIFGYDFPDKVFLKRSNSGLIIYRSPKLEELWPYGLSSIGSVDEESARYCAKYSMKRHTTGVDSGEFVLMSRKPGIGLNGYDKHIYNTDQIYLAGKGHTIPRYFDKISEQKNYFPYWLCKENRLAYGKAKMSKKYQWNLNREEEALVLANENKIYKDSLKRRYV